MATSWILTNFKIATAPTETQKLPSLNQTQPNICLLCVGKCLTFALAKRLEPLRACQVDLLLRFYYFVPLP